jgi:two-component system, chemotaxis family, CheB/CheR fusion protein
LGEERFRQDVKVYATDGDTDALIEARHGRYPEKELIPAFGEQRTRRFFDTDLGYGVFRPDLRRSLIFGRHDLVQDPPISKIDLLTCRNTLMYFTSEVQQQVLTSLHFALNPDGYLFLGKAEALATRLRLFEPVDTRQHIFRKNGQRPPGIPLLPAVAARTRSAPVPPEHLAEAVIEQSPVPQVVVDGESNLLVANMQARRYFSIGSAEVGSPLELG